jgi:hypothetical protein
MITNLFPGRFRQVAYVTNDFDRALSTVAEMTGVGSFLQLRDYEYMAGPGAVVRCHIAMALVGGVEIEILEPRGGAQDIYRDRLSGSEFGLHFHHVAYTLPSLDVLTGPKRRIQAQKAPIALEGVAPEGLTYFYADLRAPLGHYVEYVYGTPAYEAAMAAALAPHGGQP